MSLLLNTALFLCLLIVWRIIYQLHLHPLASYPGPLMAKLTNLWSVEPACALETFRSETC